MWQRLSLLDGLIGGLDFGKVGVLCRLRGPEGQAVRDVRSEVAQRLVDVGRVVVSLGAIDLCDLEEVRVGVSESIAAPFQRLVLCQKPA